MSKVWIDPDEGWRFGFPKVWDQELQPDFDTWMKENGWPEGRKIYYIRQWEAKDDEAV